MMAKLYIMGFLGAVLLTFIIPARGMAQGITGSLAAPVSEISGYATSYRLPGVGTPGSGPIPACEAGYYSTSHPQGSGDRRVVVSKNNDSKLWLCFFLKDNYIMNKENAGSQIIIFEFVGSPTGTNPITLLGISYQP